MVLCIFPIVSRGLDHTIAYISIWNGEARERDMISMNHALHCAIKCLIKSSMQTMMLRDLGAPTSFEARARRVHDVEWGFALNDDINHCPNLQLPFLSHLLSSHTQSTSLFNSLHHNHWYVGLILSIRLHWLVSGLLIRHHKHIHRNINIESTSLTRVLYFSITRSYFPTLTTINKQTFRMSSFSNTDTGNKAADPYTAKNIQDPTLKEKVEDLQSFVDKSKFCMMTTMTQDGLLASRCMALAARVSRLTF